jgi:hypothetical protein
MDLSLSPALWMLRLILETLAERHDRKTESLEVLHHLHGTPAVKGNLPNVEARSQFSMNFTPLLLKYKRYKGFLHYFLLFRRNKLGDAAKHKTQPRPAPE